MIQPTDANQKGTAPPIEQPVPVHHKKPKPYKTDQTVGHADDGPDAPQHASAYQRSPTWGILCHGLSVHTPH